ncbi:hypothetical protein [Croceimicrobium hydrocarbonivorans]|uniref:Uncharacterized protein n=1 Tax=Croceimicrobium hydrocarbonivorans TaxID=2761580 RepID=A0A7H0VCZ5_9FLAO|nr:hypothetical protein [Croceimicrobium hydrocarbonivorans]QNR23593.1 hypothetical protein H4K34_14590 [Croceimicrobium hydrocarbonivorans]
MSYKKSCLLVFLILSSLVHAQNDSLAYHDLFKHLTGLKGLIADSTWEYTHDSALYRILFSASGNFIDPKFHFNRNLNIRSIERDLDTVKLINIQVYPKSEKSSHFFQGTLQIDLPLQNPDADSILTFGNSPSIWASRIYVESMLFQKPVRIPSIFPGTSTEYRVSNPTILSFQNGKYLIVDLIQIRNYGGQTDSGFVQTYFLERLSP